MSIFKTPGLPGAAVPVSQVAAPAGDLLTVEQVSRAVPANLKNAISQSFVDQINSVVADPILADQVRNNFLSYAGVMKDGKFKTEDYLHAVVFVSYKLMGYSSKESYLRTFPARHGALVAKGTSEKDISAYVAAYARGKLVNLIMEQSMVPSWVLNQHVFQEAINTQVDIMRTSMSDKVRSDAANSLLTHLKKPEGKDFQINMDMRETSGINELKELLTKMSEKQIELIGSGVEVKEIAASTIINVTPNRGDDDDSATG